VTDGRALARTYLEQQRLLGGDAVPLSDSRTVGRSDGKASTPLPTTPGLHPGLASAGLTPGESPGKTEKGQSDSLPPAGLTFDPPSDDLFSTDPIQQAADLEAIARLVADCTKCRLCEHRANTVPGEGPADARLVVVGEGPGRTEDETGRPFVGQAGQLLAMGNAAAQTLLNTKQSLGALRNRVHRFRGVPVIVTYHPAALLRNPNWKRPTWDDVRIARRLLDG